MKKVLVFCVAALAVLAVSCQQKAQDSGIDWSKVTVDGFYVAGPATGSDQIKPECVMSAGVNEAAEGKPVRDGMYEKYIVLEGGKDFYLAYSDGGKLTYYSAELKEFETPLEEAYDQNPDKVLKGKLVIGTSPVAMKVAKTGLYHIVLDINKLGDLKEAQILLLDASAFQMMGAFSADGKKGTEADPAPTSFSNDGVTFTFKGMKLMKGAWFKFRTGNYWKVTLDDAGKVKAEVSLGAGMIQGGDNLTVEKSGIYDVTFTFKLAAGGFDKNFSYVATFKEAVAEFPDKVGIYGDYSGHNWNADGAEPIWIGAKKGEEGTGVYKGVVTMVGGTGFKVYVDGNWLGGAIDNLVDGDNLSMAEEGTFYTEINIKDEPKTIKFVKITRVGVIGDALSTGWDSDVELAYDEAKRVYSGNISFLGSGTYKIRFNNGWDYSYGQVDNVVVYDGDNFASPAAGEHEVVADFANSVSITVK